MYRHWMMKTKGKIQDTNFLFFIQVHAKKKNHTIYILLVPIIL